MNAKEKRRDQYLKRKYGISLQQYNEILQKQNGGCGICGRPPDVFKRSLAVDHCHRTNRVRGILCPFCNRGLRYYRDDPDVMERGGRYLRNPTEFFAPAKKRKRSTKAKANSRRTAKARAVKSRRKGKR